MPPNNGDLTPNLVPNTSRRVLIILGYYNNFKFSHEIADMKDERVKEVK